MLKAKVVLPVGLFEALKDGALPLEEISQRLGVPRRTAPTDPIDGRTPASRPRRPNPMAVYWLQAYQLDHVGEVLEPVRSRHPRSNLQLDQRLERNQREGGASDGAGRGVREAHGLLAAVSRKVAGQEDIDARMRACARPVSARTGAFSIQ